ncbi:MAG: CRISPR-associated RAMP protein Csx10 [Chloroflexi bacterium]|nr:MAG: CRISPR-associated RAMP protein Csx10 [Chloroflexota bacterium]
MIALTYRLTLQEPVLATALDGEPNSAVSYDYIPGSMIRGLVAAELARPTVDLATTERELLFSGEVRYLHAYPALREGERSIPAPRSWRKDKVDLDNLLIEDHALMNECESDFLNGTRDTAGFVTVDGKQATFVDSKRQITVHTLRDRFAGRPRRGLGAVYQYDALAPGSHFYGAVLVADLSQAKRLRELLPVGEYRIGGARTAGYGLVWLDDVQIADPWLEYEPASSSIAAGQQFIVTLLSDAILRDERGATCTDLLPVLQLPVVCEVAFKQVTAVGGFNRKWGMPLPQEQALQAGSVFVLRATTDIAQQQLQTLIETGVGERRAEGFGRLAFGWQYEEVLRQTKPDKQHDEIASVTLTSRERTIARRMATRRRRLSLERGLAVAIRDKTREEPPNRPPNSQLSRVRIIVRSALKERDPSRVLDLFRDDDRNYRALRRNARQKFDRCRLGQGEDAPRLSTWISELCKNPESIWDGPLNREDQSLGGETPETGWLAEEYALRLIDGVLEELMRQNRKGGK